MIYYLVIIEDKHSDDTFFLEVTFDKALVTSGKAIRLACEHYHLTEEQLEVSVSQLYCKTSPCGGFRVSIQELMVRS